MVRKWAGGAAAVAVAAVAGIGWLVVQRQAQVALDQGVAQIRERLGPDMRFSYASATPSVLHRNARFAGVLLTGHGGTVTADTLVVGCDAASVCSGTADGVHGDAKEPAAAAWTADHVGWTNLAVPPGSGTGAGSAALDLALGARFDAAEVRGVHLAGGGGGEMTVTAIGITDYGRGRRGRGTLDGLTVSAPAPGSMAQQGPATGTGATDGSGPAGMIRVRLGHMAYDGVDAAANAAAMQAGTAMPAAQGQQTSEMTELDVARGEATLMHVGRLSSVNDTLASGAAHGVLDATDVRPGGMDAVLQPLGYGQVAGDLHLDAALDRAAGELTIAALRVTAPGLGQASLSGGFGHIPQGMGTGAPDMAAMLGLTLRGFDLVLVDGGLMQHVLDERAKQAGTSAGQLRDAVAQQIGAVPMASDAGRSVQAALAAFVRAPGTLTLGLHPATPLTVPGLAQLAGGTGGPDGVIRLLNLTAVAK